MTVPSHQSTRRRAATMQDVADMLHVSKQTVSAVINNKPGITAETRTRVLDAIAQINYRMDLRARSLRTGRSYTMALVITDVASPMFSKMAIAAEERLYAEHYSLVLYNTHDDLERERFCIDSILQRSVDGVMFVSASDESTSLEMLEAAGIPSVVIDRVPKSYVGAAVVLDNHAAGRIAAAHLTDLGHKQLAYIGGPANVHIARERLDGFRAGAATAGVMLADQAIHHAENWHVNSGYGAMLALLKRKHDFSAVFCAGDLLAIGAMHALAEQGVNIPADISVMGLDDIDLAAYFTPPLTTISQSITSMATLGVELLLDELAGRPRASNRIVIEPTLVARASTAPPRT